MRSPLMFRSYGVLLQVCLALHVISMWDVAITEPATITREIVASAGPAGMVLMYAMLACALVWLADVVLNLEMGVRGFGWLRVAKPWAGWFIATGWVAFSFCATFGVYAPGVVRMYLINAFLVAAAVLMDASRCRAVHAKAPAAS